MRYFVRQPKSNRYFGPFSTSEIQDRLTRGTFTWEFEWLEASGQTERQLGASTEWRRLDAMEALDQLEPPSIAPTTLNSNLLAKLILIREETAYSECRWLIDVTTNVTFLLTFVVGLCYFGLAASVGSIGLFLAVAAMCTIVILVTFLSRQLLHVFVDIADVLLKQTQVANEVENAREQ